MHRSCTNLCFTTSEQNLRWIIGNGRAALPSPAAATAARAAVQAFEALGRAERLLTSGGAAGAADTLQVGSV